MNLRQVEWGKVGKAALKEYNDDDVGGLAAEMAYWIVFSIFPLFAFLAFLAGIISRFIGIDQVLSDATSTVLSPLGQQTQEQVATQLETILRNQGGALSFGAIFSALIALNTASSAVMTTMKAFNRAYGVEETRNFIVKKLVAIGLTLVLVVLLVGGALLLSLGGTIIGALNLGTVGTILSQIARFVLPIIGISLALAILYWKGPNLDQQFQWISPGSIIATLTLILFSLFFAIYLQVIGTSGYARTYGAIAGVIIFLFFLRWASTIVLLGAEFNAETAKRYDPATIRDKITDPRKQLPGQQPMPDPEAMRQAGVTREQVIASNVDSAKKLIRGEGTPASATMNMWAKDGDHAVPTSAGAGATAGAAGVPDRRLTDGVLDDPEVKERLRAIRERPYVSAQEEARREQVRLSAAERARRARTTQAAFGVSAATAIGGVVLNTLRRVAR